jgi:hypothetical protein
LLSLLFVCLFVSHLTLVLVLVLALFLLSSFLFLLSSFFCKIENDVASAEWIIGNENVVMIEGTTGQVGLRTKFPAAGTSCLFIQVIMAVASCEIDGKSRQTFMSRAVVMGSALYSMTYQSELLPVDAIAENVFFRNLFPSPMKGIFGKLFRKDTGQRKPLLAVLRYWHRNFVEAQFPHLNRWAIFGFDQTNHWLGLCNLSTKELTRIAVVDSFPLKSSAFASPVIPGPMLGGYAPKNASWVEFQSVKNVYRHLLRFGEGQNSNVDIFPVSFTTVNAQERKGERKSKDIK